MSTAPPQDFPDGLSPRHCEPSVTGWAGAALPFIALGAVMMVGISGVAGGYKDRRQVTLTDAASLAVTAPQTLRNGEIFEITTEIRAPVAIEKPVLAISGELFRHLTINTMTPEPAGQSFSQGKVELEFEPLNPGDMLQFRISGQSNPSLSGGNGGLVELREDERVLAALPVSIRILP